MNPTVHPSYTQVQQPPTDVAQPYLSTQEFAELDAMLDARRMQVASTPRWEFCEGFMAALICCRRQISSDEYLPVLLSSGQNATASSPFTDWAHGPRFLALWTRRWHAVRQALDTKITALDDAAAYQPELVDARAALAARPAGESIAATDAKVPSFGQLWSLGFMAVVAAWPEEWIGPRNKQAQMWRTSALDFVSALTHDDVDVPTLPAYVDVEGPPTVSVRRMKAFGDALWAVYNMREMWRSLGPRIETVHKTPAPARNEPCTCGSGKKFKKCCGA